MRVLILGITGMLGHKLWQVGSGGVEVWGSVRRPIPDRWSGLFGRERIASGVDAREFSTVASAVSRVEPEVVVNCIGIIKQLPEASDPITAIEVNSLFPQRLAAHLDKLGTRLIHVSTDCVFSGKRGGYTEDVLPDPPDLYGRSKLLGEVDSSGTLTLRTSIIGRELRGFHGLIEWFLSRRGESVRGFTHAVFSGLTTLVVARLIFLIIHEHPALSGLYHVAGEAISKYELLRLVREAYGLEVGIEPDDSVRIDRSLVGTRFQEATGWTPPGWAEMIEELAADPTPYAESRGSDAA